jgi:hypothetical protein
MTINEIKQLILVCTRFTDGGNQKDINTALKAVDKLQQKIKTVKELLIETENDYRNITVKFTCELLDELIKDKI